MPLSRDGLDDFEPLRDAVPTIFSDEPIKIVLDMEEENLKNAMKVFSSHGYKPRAPVSITEFTRADRRAEWIAQKGLTVFSLWNEKDPMTEIDLFVRPESRFKARQDIDDRRDNDGKNQNQSPRNIFQ